MERKKLTMKIRRFYDSRSLHAYLMLLPESKHAEVTEHRTENLAIFWLVAVSDPEKPAPISLAEAWDNLKTLRAQNGG